MEYEFGHESLTAYQVAVGVARTMGAARWPRGEADLRVQGVRAARSVVLNIAEGRGRTGDARRLHYAVALGSAAEACAVLDLSGLNGEPELQEKLRRVGAMLCKLGR